LKTLITLAVGAVIVVIGAVGIALSGWINVGASSPHSPAANWLLGSASHASIERRARQVTVPDLDDPELSLAGVNDFAAMCAGCHGAPGQPPEAMGQGLNPPAPNLAESAEHLSPAELFWVTKHGIRMTGMPSWGATHDDQSLWPVVAFMTMLPELDADEYQAYLTRAAGLGHHTGDSQTSHDHGDTDHGNASGHNEHETTDPAVSPEIQEERDHGAHPHDSPSTKSATDSEHDHSSHNH